MDMICPRRKECGIEICSGRCNKHEKNDWCDTVFLGCPKCVPYVPEYVRVTGCLKPRLWYSCMVGAIFKTTGMNNELYW